MKAIRRYKVDLIENLKSMKKISLEDWILEQENLYRCLESGSEIYIPDFDCFDCGINYDPNSDIGGKN